MKKGGPVPLATTIALEVNPNALGYEIVSHITYTTQVTLEINQIPC